MLIRFVLNYHTSWGETLWLCFSPAGAEALAYPLSWDGDENWSLMLDMPDDIHSFDYHYELRSEERTLRKEWGRQRHFTRRQDVREYVLQDSWQQVPDEKTFYTLPFTSTFRARSHGLPNQSRADGKITIRVAAPGLLSRQQLVVSGSTPALGRWNAEKALRMDDRDFPLWSITLPADALRKGDEYKFAILDTLSGAVTDWEQGQNRVWDAPAQQPGVYYVLSGLTYRAPSGGWKGAGVAIPVFSLRSERSGGIGDFADLRKFVDWAALTGQRVIQVLPVNDTTTTHTWADSYPYRAISIFALHPLYLSMDEMGALQDAALAEEVERERLYLNQLGSVDYERVERLKWTFFKSMYRQDAARLFETEAYKSFFEKNREWLMPYAAFSYLRDKNHTADFNNWPGWATYNREVVSKLCTPGSPQYDEIAIYFFLQYHLDRQLIAARDYGHKKGVVLKGDIPIGISRNSVDAWTEPCLFNLDGQAGAPPDDFSVTGQNWGFPTYNWEVMAQDDYSWWRKRFTKMADYFDVYRIDHILGFFRIWEIPEDSVQGLLGHFNPALPFTRDELEQRGFPMHDDRYLKPFIHESFLSEFFGEELPHASRYLIPTGNGYYRLKPEYDSQVKVRNHFEGKQDNSSQKLQDALFGLINEVLFVRDPSDPERFHPRITAQYTFSYRYLNDYERGRYDELYTHFFYHRHNDFWAAHAMQKLPALIDSTDMLVCAEDLGMIPACVSKVLSRLQVITLEIQRMPKDPRQLFGLTNHYPYLSVCTTSTHDMSTIRGWWEEDHALTQRYYNEILWRGGEAPQFASGEICETILRNHLESPAILAVLPLQDWLSVNEQIRRENPADERINIPADPNHYWRYRMHLTIEKLVSAEYFNHQVRELIARSGR